MKIKTFLFLLIIAIFSSCTKDEEPILIEEELSDYELSVIDYFKEVALGFEFGTSSKITRKWNSRLKIFVGGQASPDLLDELDIIITEINQLATDGFNVSIVNDSIQSNYYIFFGSGREYAAIYPDEAQYVESNFGLFFINWNRQNQFTSGHMYVDIVRADPINQKHLLREELTQSLGLARDSPNYQESIFYLRPTTTTEYAVIDRDLIRLLYHPNMQIGLNGTQVGEVLKEILLSER